jgi:hypothetical protein
LIDRGPDVTVQLAEAPDPVLERQIDHLLDSLRARYEKSRVDSNADGWVTYKLLPRAGLNLRLDLELCADTLNVNFNGCYLMLEAVAHMPKFRGNPKAFNEWRDHTLVCVRNILTSNLKVETRSRWGRLLGGFLYRWDGQKWECCGGGGSLLLPFGDRVVSEYPAWLAKQTDLL